MTDHPRSDLLVDPDWLQAHLNDTNLRIVDCGSREAYGRVHIPGAVCTTDANYKSTDPDKKRFIMDAEEFAQAMQDLGIGDNTEVVAYDAAQTTAGRLWWCLNYYGHTKVRVLDGGWNRWLAEARPMTMEITRAAPAGAFTATPHPEVYATAEYVMQALSNPDAIVLDVRSDGEWLGTNSRGNKRAGRMPGAVHLEWVNYLTADPTRRWKSAAELKAMFEAIGVTPEKEVITVCQGGIRAAQAAFTLNLLGYPNVRNYDGSFGDWGNREDTPIIT